MEDWLSMLNALFQAKTRPPNLPARKPRVTFVLQPLPGLSQMVNSAMPCGMVKGVRCFTSAHVYLWGACSYAPELCNASALWLDLPHANRSCCAEQLLHAVGILSEPALAMLAKTSGTILGAGAP